MSMQTPLLHDDELNPGEPQVHDGFGEELPGRVETHNFIKRTWYRHKRACLLLLAASTATVALVIILMTVLTTKRTANEDTGIIPPEDEKLASDPRLEKYQTLADTLFRADWVEDDSSRTALSTASFSLPPETNLTFFLSRGGPTFGHFYISDERAPSGEITVDVLAQYEDTEEGRAELERSKACFAGQENEQGIMLWADSDAALSHVKFNISVHLPDIQGFHDISTDLTNGVFSHFIESFFDIWRPTYFGVVRLNARNARMYVGTVFASSIFVQTSNAEIKGSFWATESIALQTSNAAVFATLWAIGQHDEAETDVSVRTSNSPITAGFSMASDFSHTKLNASMYTSNGNLSIFSPRFGMPAEKPVFLLDASTSNAPVSFYLQPDYEGTFDLETTIGTASVDYNPDERDGKGRKRVVDMHGANEKSHKAGSIYWGDEPPKEDQGDIRLRSTKKNIVIKTSDSSQMDLFT